MRTPGLTLPSLDLAAAEKALVEEALRRAGSICDAAELLGITRHATKRRITKHRITWPTSSSPSATGGGGRPD